MIEREIKKLELQNGVVPFDEWFDSLRDKRMQAAVDARWPACAPEILVIANPWAAACLNCESHLGRDCGFIMDCTASRS